MLSERFPRAKQLLRKKVLYPVRNHEKESRIIGKVRVPRLIQGIRIRTALVRHIRLCFRAVRRANPSQPEKHRCFCETIALHYRVMHHEHRLKPEKL